MRRGVPDSIRIEVGRSFFLAAYLHLLHSLSLLFCLAFAPANLHRLLLSAFVLLSWIWLSARHLYRHERLTLSLLPDGCWTVRDPAADKVEQLRFQDGFVSHRLTILRFSRGRFGSRCFLLLPDNCDAELHRRLRVRLRQGVTRPDQVAGSCPVS